MDLTFILLITFIITFPLIEQGIAVNLPKGKAADMSPAQSRNITLNADKQLYIDTVPVSKATLQKTLNDLAKNAPDTTIYVRADKKLPYGDVVDIMRMLHDANITRMALVTAAE